MKNIAKYYIINCYYQGIGGNSVNSLRNFFITFLIAILVFGICAYFITGFIYDSIDGLLSGNNKPVETTEGVSGDVTTAPSEVINPLDDIDGESFTVLLIGTDYRPSVYDDYHPDVASQYPSFPSSEKLIGYGGALPEYPYRTVHADAVMLIRVSKEKQTIAYLSIPSNAQLNIGGVNTTVADLYYEKGLDYFVSKMSGITGVPIDYYALASIELLDNVVNALGSVTYEVPCNMEYEDDTYGFKISLRKGTQEINGNKAVQLLSFNSYEDSSLSREKTAVGFLQALALKMTNVANINKASDVFKSVSKHLYTDITAEDLAANLDLIFSYSRFKVISVEYPGSYFSRDGKLMFNPYINLAITKMEEYK